MSTLKNLGEAGLLRALKRRLATCPKARGVAPVLGIGDDAALLQAGPHTVVSCDMVVEDVDFRRRWASWRDVGHKAAAINLSDLAAMGATPRGLIVALAAAATEQAQSMVTLLASVHRVGARVGAPLVGGDLSATSGPLVVSVTAIGALSGPALRRHAGLPKDIIAVTGTLGGAAAGLMLLEHAQPVPGLSAHRAKQLVARQLRPHAQLTVAQALQASGCVRSCADVSDGLLGDIEHVLRPGCGARIASDCLPVQPGVQAVARHEGTTALAIALTGGEDFELVMAIAPGAFAQAQALCARFGVALTAVGVVVAKRGVQVVGRAAQAELRGHGFDHYS